jgi:hypothetical protein
MDLLTSPLYGIYLPACCWCARTAEPARARARIEVAVVYEGDTTARRRSA